MADADKNIRITGNRGKGAGIFPQIVFTGSSAGTSVLTLEVRDDNTVAFKGIEGDVFSLDYNLSTGTIWSVNDISGFPLLRADVGAASGATIRISEGTGFVGIGQTNPKYKLDVQGWAGFASTGDGSYTVLLENGLATGNNALSIRAANALRFYNSGNTFFTGFIGSQSGVNTTYTLPATSPATGSSVLQSTAAGVLSWVPMVAGGGPSGTINSSTVNNIAYYSAATTLTGDVVANGNFFQYTGDGRGLVLANVDAEFNTTSGSTKLLTVGTGATNYSTVRKALAVISTNNAWTNGDLLVLGVGNLASNVRFGVDWTGRVQIGTPGTGFTLPATNGTSGQVLTANTNGLATWTTSGGGSGSVNSGTAGSVAFYAADGTAVSGTGLIQVLTSGIAISVNTNLDLRTQNDIRFFNSGNTFYTALQAANNSANYTLSLPTAPVGVGYSVILVDTTGQMYFAPAEGGLATTSVTGNRVVLRNKMEHHVWMAAGYTPPAAGPDNVIYRVPDSSEDGNTDLTFSIKEFTIRVETPSAGSSRIQLELSSTRTGAFTLGGTGSSLIGGSGLTISGAGIYLTTLNTFSAGIFITSGDLLRLNWSLLNATHANFSVAFTLNEV
jgi:hypothetical protein